MKSSTRALAGVAAIAVAACVSSASFAQAAPPGAPPSPEAARQHWAEQRHEHAEARARALHDVLNLRPDQEPALQAFIAAMKPAEGPEGWGEDHDKAAPTAPLTTPERLDRLAARLAKRQAAFQQRAQAIKTFYAALSPEQQRAFDALPRLQEEGGHGPKGSGGFEGRGHDD
jgi:protein CpxP